MRIAVNTRLLLKGRLEGIGWFTWQTLEPMVHRHPEHEFYFFFDRPFDPSFITAPNVHPVVVGPQARHPLLFMTWLECSVPYALKKHKIDLFLSPDGFLSLRTPVPTCLVVHDLAFEHFPEHIRWSQRKYWRWFSPRFARRADRIVTVSSFSKQDIVSRYQIEAAKIDIVPNAAHEEYRPLTWEEKQEVKANLTGGAEYFVFAGALHPRKNVYRLLKAFIRFKRRQRTQLKLVIVGRLAWKYEEIIRLKEEMPFKEDVIWTGYQDVDALSRIMGAAYALVYPSLFEGFGIPILEAMQAGVPVIVSRSSSMPEVAGDAGLLVDPMSEEDIAEKMEQLHKDERLRADLAAKALVRAAQFNWETSSQKLWESMMACLPKSKGGTGDEKEGGRQK